MGSKLVIILTISFFFIISQTEGIQKRNLKQLNKSAIKTIFTKYGDIFDCVDIHKQPSLNHPLLQNHTLQAFQSKPIFTFFSFFLTSKMLNMKPSPVPEASSHESAHKEKNYVQIELEDGGCPEGFVPIKRLKKQDLIRLRAHLNSVQNSGWHGASIHTKRLQIPFRAARGLLNVCRPTVTKEQNSDSLVYVQHGESNALNAIQAGWTVSISSLQLFNVLINIMMCIKFIQLCMETIKFDSILCGHGFIQVSKNLALGAVISPVSEFGGTQTYFSVVISHDQYSGNWWLIAQSVMVGYWPKEIFTTLSSYGEEAGWGGRAHSTLPELAPPIGSGHKPEEGYGKACFVEEMQFVRTGQGIYEDLNADMLLNHVDEGNSCYGVKLFMDAKDKANIFFGGPGGDCP
ncbi:hypothetical protein V2J09_014670 [Rumex salicifolius]